MNNEKDSLGNRMKGYEQASRSVLPNRLPVIVRVDGKAFHTYTAGCKRPFDERLSGVMISTATKLCEEIQGAQLAYTQSDEISILVHGYKTFTSQPWFDNQIQKIVSVAAGIASSHFTALSWRIWRDEGCPIENDSTWDALTNRIKPAVFDARAFVVPEADVCNYFLWRQQDATRNSVQMLARSLYSHKQCDNKNVIELKEMCLKKNVDWNALATRWQRGACIRRAFTNDRNPWQLDDNIPLFSERREYVNDLLVVKEQ